MLRSVYRILGMLLSLVFLFVLPVTSQGIVLDNAWVTRDVVPQVNGSCGGVLLDDATVLTARHCLNRLDAFTVRFANTEMGARVTCLSSVESDATIGALSFRASASGRRWVRYDDVQAGEPVLIAGYPDGVFVVMLSVVLAKQRMGYIIATRTVIDTFYVLSNPLGRGLGFSGGGVFDAQRRLIGIVCCVNEVLGVLAMIPLERQVRECSLPHGG